MTITIKHVSGNELYSHYSGQTNAQPVFVELDCQDDTLTARASGEIGNAVPAAVYHGHVRRWSIPALRAKAANDLLEQIAPLAERVVAGYESHWNGSNHIARFSNDADAAMEEIERICDDSRDDTDDMIQAWNAADWYSDLGRAGCARHFGLTADTTDEEIEDIAAKHEAKDLDPGTLDVLEGLPRYLHDLRDRLRDED